MKSTNGKSLGQMHKIIIDQVIPTTTIVTHIVLFCMNVSYISQRLLMSGLRGCQAFRPILESPRIKG